MKLLLTHAYFLEDDVKEQQIMRPYAPLGILYISGWLDEKRIPHSVFDTTFSSKQELRAYIKREEPDMVGIYVNLMTKLNVLELIQFVRSELPRCIIVLGGPEVRDSAENFLLAGADYIVVGEGEETMAELSTLNLNSLRKRLADHIKGISFLRDGVFVQNGEREKIKNLDELPVPARHRIDLFKYLDVWKEHHGKNAISISTMRGCPYTCKWCSRAVYGLSYRRRSPEKVVDELALIQHRYKPDTLWFVDDVFTISHKWLTAFNDELKKRNLHISYECITRADRMNETVVRLLKDTGCFRVWIGAESGSQRIIDLMDRRVDVNQVREMIRLTKRYQIEAGTFIMLGYPGETEADIEETIRHLKESNPDHFTITVAYPIRGTDLYTEVENLQTQRADWNTTTDRQIEFKRTYRRRYYDFAVRRVVNEVQTFKALNEKKIMKALELKMKSWVAKGAMAWIRSLPDPS